MSQTFKTSNRRAALLRELFQDVCDKANWKNPVIATVPADMAELYAEAIEFMTGSVVHRGGTFKRLQLASAIACDHVVLSADGYYLAVGA
jgi:hypothetical protein